MKELIEEALRVSCLLWNADIENYTVKDKLTAQEILGNIIAFITVAIGSIVLLMLGAIMDKL